MNFNPQLEDLGKIEEFINPNKNIYERITTLLLKYF
jgi:hypothetical protein